MICAVGNPFINYIILRVNKLHFCADKFLAVNIDLWDLDCDWLVDSSYFNHIAVLRNSNRIALITKNISCGSFDFMNNILAIGDFVEHKISVFIWSGSHYCSISAELHAIGSKQPEHRIFKRFALVIYLVTLYPATLEKIYELSAVNIHSPDVLSHIFEVYKILFAVKNIVFIGCNFLNIIPAERYLYIKFCGHILIKWNLWKQSVGRNHRTVSRLYILRRKQSETNREILIIVSDSEQLVVLHNLRKWDFNTLIIIDKWCIYRIKNSDFLSCIGQFYKLWFAIPNIAVRCLNLLDFVLTEIQ